MAERDQSKKKTNNPKSYQGRKNSKRKLLELATLCDIKVCSVIIGPNGKLQTWPDNLDAYKKILDLYSQSQKPKKKHKESSTPVPKLEEEQGEKNLLTLVESKLVTVNRRIHFLENKNVDVANKGKRKRIE